MYVYVYIYIYVHGGSSQGVEDPCIIFTPLAHCQSVQCDDEVHDDVDDDDDYEYVCAMVMRMM